MPDAVHTVPVTIEVELAAAAPLDDPATRVRIGRLVSRTLHHENVERLTAAMDALAADAERRGLTDEILDEELAAYNAERRERPPPGDRVRHLDPGRRGEPPHGVPHRAFLHALRADRVAVSEGMLSELREVLARPRLARFLSPELCDEVLALLSVSGILFAPSEHVTDCRDPKDGLFLELALASGAGVLVSSDNDLLVLHPWRGVRILRLAEYLAEVEGSG